MSEFLRKLKKEIRAFEQLQEQFAATGASDTEPDAEFQHALASTLKGKEYCPRTVDDWQLYTDEPGSNSSAVAAAALTQQLEKILALLRTEKATLPEGHEIRAYIRSYCWRCG